MCGFVGFYNLQDKKNKQTEIDNMLEKIIHRGPDSKGEYVDDKIALGFRRLSILDLSENGTQPFISEDGNYILVFNGEIYNYIELREELKEKGYEFKTETDTEVLLNGYIEYKKDILSKLRGMFSFVVWNKKTQEMFAARDHFGIKPFYYAQIGENLFFGSEIKSFLPHSKFEKEINLEPLKPYLNFQYSPLDETFFKNVFKLKPGHYFTYSGKDMEIQEYYKPMFEETNKDAEKAIKEVDKIVEDSVEIHRRSDVPLGSFLSSGIDSSYITKKLMPNKTFSVGFDNNGFNETIEAKKLSDKLKISNVSKVISADEFFEAVGSVQYHSDEPHANLSAVPLYFLSKMAREHVTVVLSGEGADELFGGYHSYFYDETELKFQKLPNFIKRPLGKIASVMPDVKGKNFLVRNGLSVEDEYIGQAKVFSEKSSNAVLNKDLKSNLKMRDITKKVFSESKDKSNITKKQNLDMHFWLPQDILLKADKMTMAHSLELRVPFLDKVVADYATKLDESLKYKNKVSKYVLRKAALDNLPEDWALRRKIGFPVPFSKWIMEEKYMKIVKDEFEKEYTKKFFNQDRLLKLLSDHYNKKKNNARKVWTVFAFLKWYEVYFINE